MLTQLLLILWLKWLTPPLLLLTLLLLLSNQSSNRKEKIIARPQVWRFFVLICFANTSSLGTMDSYVGRAAIQPINLSTVKTRL